MNTSSEHKSWYMIVGLMIALAVGYGISQFVNVSNVLPIEKVGFWIIAFGLYASIHGVDIVEARRRRFTVLSAVTIGVALKVGIISLVSYLFIRDLHVLSFALAVAALDPLSVAALLRQKKSGFSKEGKSLLRIWSSFDDPVSNIVHIYLVLPIFGIIQGGFFAQLGENMLFAGVVYLLTRVIKSDRGQFVLLAVVFAVTFWQGWALGLAICALYLRPKLEPALGRLAMMVFWGVTILLGTMLDISPQILWQGFVIGGASVLAQFVTATILTAHFHRSDRIYLRRAQYAGMTAIAMAVFLHQLFGGQVASIIAVAVVTINGLYFMTNWQAEKRVQQLASSDDAIA